MWTCSFFFFFFNDTATTEIYTLSLHDALPIWIRRSGGGQGPERQMSGRGPPSPPALCQLAPSSLGRFWRNHHYGGDSQRPRSKTPLLGRKQPIISLPGRKSLYMASGRKPIFSVDNSLDFTIKVENHYLLAISGLASCTCPGKRVPHDTNKDYCAVGLFEYYCGQPSPLEYLYAVYPGPSSRSVCTNIPGFVGAEPAGAEHHIEWHRARGAVRLRGTPDHCGRLGGGRRGDLSGRVKGCWTCELAACDGRAPKDIHPGVKWLGCCAARLRQGWMARYLPREWFDLRCAGREGIVSACSAVSQQWRRYFYRRGRAGRSYQRPLGLRRHGGGLR